MDDTNLRDAARAGSIMGIHDELLSWAYETARQSHDGTVSFSWSEIFAVLDALKQVAND